VDEIFKSIENNEDVDLYDCGTHKRDFLYVDDAVYGINMILDKGKFNEIYNVGSGQSTSIIELLTKYKEQINSKTKFGCKEPPRFHKICQQLKDVELDISKIKSFGYSPKWNTIDKIVSELCKQ
jgi:nucleoside-diphosphate-sugar epimerase